MTIDSWTLDAQNMDLLSQSIIVRQESILVVTFMILVTLETKLARESSLVAKTWMCVAQESSIVERESNLMITIIESCDSGNYSVTIVDSCVNRVDSRHTRIDDCETGIDF